MYQKTLRLTKQLVNISSPSGNEEDILRFIAAWLSDHDFSEVEQQPLFTAGKIAGTNARQALILCGHVDTVVAGDLTGWHTPPCEPIEKDGKLYGLGTSDMKAGLAAHMVVAESFRQSHLPIDIWIAAVAGEETNGSGAKAFISWFNEHTAYEKVSCIIAEPTDLERVEIGHRGSSFVELTFNGAAGHASQQASYATSGLKLAQDFLGDLPLIVKKVQQFNDPTLGAPTIVPTVISAGSAHSPNKTSDTACIILDVRTTPTFDAAIDTWAAALAKKYSASWRFTEPPTYAGLCDDKAPIVQIALGASGCKMPTISFGATDQFSFQAAGIDTIVFGPGEFAQAHVQNEYVVPATLRRAITIYHTIIKEFAKH